MLSLSVLNPEWKPSSFSSSQSSYIFHVFYITYKIFFITYTHSPSFLNIIRIPYVIKITKLLLHNSHKSIYEDSTIYRQLIVSRVILQHLYKHVIRFAKRSLIHAQFQVSLLMVIRQIQQ